MFYLAQKDMNWWGMVGSFERIPDQFVPLTLASFRLLFGPWSHGPFVKSYHKVQPPVGFDKL